jgi:site-specific DNA-methyltransferase (adenine-specific)
MSFLFDNKIELNNIIDINSNITCNIEEMDLTKLSKTELLVKCKENGIKKYKSKNKGELIVLLQNKTIKEDTKETIISSTISTISTIPTIPTISTIPTIPTISTISTIPTIPTIQNTIDIKNITGIEYLKTICNGSIDLILTDPPYIISKDSGMNEHYNNVKFNEENDITQVKTEDEWEEYKNENGIEDDINKEKYIKYGSIYGKKYCVKTNYGNWDSDFTLEILEHFICEYYKKLKKGGTLIMFFDLWKITDLKCLLEKYKFKQIRFIEWIKTNPQPRNSRVNYLTNCREIALIGVKEGNPTFNSSYDNGIYMYPLQGGKNRFHPTQKSLILFEELIKKHSNENDTILDTFLGSGTTAIACKNTKRNFKGCEISKEYYDKILEIL